MRCNVPYCISDSNGKRTAKSQGITFHKFPKNPNIRKAWLKVLGITTWEPQNSSVICSEHFKEEDFYVTKGGQRHIHSDAVPVRKHDLETPAALMVCRVCLTMDAHLHDIRKFKPMFEQITGLSTSDEESARLPQRVCWECAARLTAAANFKAKALLSDGLLHELLKPDTCLKIRDIKTIKRKHYGLKTNLIQELFESEHFDVSIRDTFVENIYNPDMIEDDYINTEEIFETYQNNDHDYDISQNVTTKNNQIKNNKIEILQNGNIDENHKKKFPIIPSDNKETETVSEMLHKAVLELEEIDLGVNKIDEIIDNDMLCDQYNRSDDEVLENEEMDDEDEMPIKELKSNIRYFPRQKKEKRAAPKVAKPSYRKDRAPIDTSLFTITSLTVEEQVEEVQKRRESEAYKNATYKCTICYKVFKSKDSSKTHSMKHSEEKGRFECFICKTRKKFNTELRTHMLLQHTEQYSCKKCDLVTRHRGVALQHVNYHAGNIYKCPHCPREFTKNTTYRGHLRLKHTTDVVCEFCGYTFVSEKGVCSHKAKKHPHVRKTVPLEGPFCEVCDVRFATQEAHDRHLRTSSKHLIDDNDPMRIRNEYRPEIPLRKRVWQPRRRDPVRQNLRSTPVECEQCGVVLRNQHHYVRHFLHEHPGKKRTKHPKTKMKTLHMCEECGKLFFSLEQLECHKWVHTGKKKYQCDHCNKTFSTKMTLVNHINRLAGKQYGHPCRYCGKMISTVDNLKRHEFLHTGEKPFKCVACDKSFATAGQLTQHKDHVHDKKPWPRKVKRKRRNSERVED